MNSRHWQSAVELILANKKSLQQLMFHTHCNSSKDHPVNKPPFSASGSRGSQQRRTAGGTDHNDTMRINLQLTSRPNQQSCIFYAVYTDPDLQVLSQSCREAMAILFLCHMLTLCLQLTVQHSLFSVQIFPIVSSLP